MASQADHWSRWLLERRHGGDARQRSIALEHLAPIRDRVLANAGPLDGVTLLDVGAGDGLIGLKALERVGPAGTVIFSDVSSALLERCQETVRVLGSLERARFVVARAEDLDGIADGSVDVITTRSVLIYVTEKADAFAAFYRALRPGGGSRCSSRSTGRPSRSRRAASWAMTSPRSQSWPTRCGPPSRTCTIRTAPR